MSEVRNPGELTRVPRAPSAGTLPELEREPEQDITPEQALAEAQEAQRRAEQERDAARAQAQATARERDEARIREQSAGADALTSRERSIIAGIETATSAADRAEQAIAIANAAGDSAAVAKAFRELAAAQADLGRLSDQKAWFEGERERLKNQPPPQQPQPAGDVYEIQTPGGVLRASPGVKAWVDRHPRFTDVSNPGYYNHAVATHGTILQQGYQEGSPAYFRALDEAMTKYEKFEAYERGEREEPRVQTRQQRPGPTTTGAPVSRETSAPRSSGTPDPRTIASWLGVTEADMREFARHNGYRGEAGYQLYLKEQDTIRNLERQGEPTGLVVDRVYR